MDVKFNQHPVLNSELKCNPVVSIHVDGVPPNATTRRDVRVCPVSESRFHDALIKSIGGPILLEIDGQELTLKFSHYEGDNFIYKAV